MTGERPALRAYRSLVRLYPQQFREDYCADMVRLFRDQCDDEPALRVFARAAVDLALTIPRQHLEAHMKQPSTHLIPLLYTTLAFGGLLCAAVGGTNAGIVAIGLIIAGVTATMAGIAWKRSGPIGGRISTHGWWKLVLAGPCIIGAVILAAELGVDAWMVGMFAVLTAFVVTGVGVVLGIVRLFKHPSPPIRT